MKGTLMHTAPRAPFFVALAVTASLALTSCMANASAGGSGSASDGGTPATSPSATSAPSSASPTAAGDEPASSASSSAVLTKYTFPDGRLSFHHPADWKVEQFTAATSPFVGTATVYDASGAMQATLYSGPIADGVTSPVTRTVFESLPVPGLQDQPAPVAHYSFYVDRVNDIPTYRMHLTAGAPIAGAEMALDGIIRVGDGVLVSDVQFIEKPFATDNDAKAWLGGAEGQALKALLMSISYR